MKSIVAYGLYSNEKEIENFKKQINEEVKKNNDWKLEKIYIDYDKKRANHNYKALMTMLNETINGKKDIILVKNIQQFFKAIHGIEFIIKYLEKEKIEVKFLDENISTVDTMGRMQLAIMFSVDEFEREARERRFKNNQLIEKEKFEKAKAIIENKKNNTNLENATFEEQRNFLIDEIKDNKNYKIIGYDFVDGKYIVNEKEAEAIRENINKEIKQREKEEQRRKANESRSEKMKELWQNEEYRQEMSERIKIGKKMKKMER